MDKVKKREEEKGRRNGKDREKLIFVKRKEEKGKARSEMKGKRER